MFNPRALRRGAAAIALFSALALAPTAPCVAEVSAPYRQEVRFAHHTGFFVRVWHLMTILWGGEGTTTDPTGHH
jgi:hypothetical protein